MPDFYGFLPPLLAVFLILRRGLKPQRVKPDRLWLFPGIIAVLALLAIWNGKPPSLVGWIVYAGAVAAGGVFGWLTTQHIELTLDDKTGTVMSQPSRLSTLTTAAVFLARYAIEYASGHPGKSALTDYLVAHGASLVLITNAGLLFVATRGLSRAWHMVMRIHPMLEAHKASKAAQG